MGKAGEGFTKAEGRCLTPEWQLGGRLGSLTELA